ncbi:hydantoinase/oxoprolinase family protein [Burkholderia cenocepacia]|uniref:hydantoinase/oxoprolinase family protein n=1 Tax=Burkholderia cenocepacia TaxID=95486 RepID=UPI0026549A00|nr:hydantoinase/oxoprolinase family protein [Burkholderia cenocepacia]MDN7683151.1 hydantoinase/oxoprolinase family protein [Burkholderia cenocepacia]
MWRVGVDVGGTFTDLFAWQEGSNVCTTAKVLTTRHDRTEGVLEAVKKTGIAFSDISLFMHGTTTGTNALLERSYPEAAFITTEGFRDTLEIGRQHRKYLYDPYQTKPVPLIKRRNRYVVSERMSAQGVERRPLDEREARKIAEAIAAKGIKSIGIGFINSYANPMHEQRMKEIVLDVIPDAFVEISADTRPIFREHGRFVTTAIRTVLRPVMATYFTRLEERMRDEGFTGSLLILKSNGGVMGAELASARPEELIESGPAGGVAYATYLYQNGGYENIIHTDVGGTSFDASIVEKGQGLITHTYELEWEMPVSVPMLDIHSVGAGGGSVGWVDDGGALRVGPRSAGSEPGPACYGRGGTEATITDANLVLGRLNPSLNGKFTLDVKAAEAAIDTLAQKIGRSRLETAEGMIRISCETMAQAVKSVVLERSRDPRDFVFASFGGAGPLHACFVARSMNVPEVLIPTEAGVASAFGATAMNIRQDIEGFHYADLQEDDLEALNKLYQDLEARARDLLAKDGVKPDEMELTRTAQMRYVGQTYEVETPIPNGIIKDPQRDEIAQAFHTAHRREYGTSSDDFSIAFVSLSVKAIGRIGYPPVFPAKAIGAGDGDIEPPTRQVYFDGVWHESKVYASHSLPSSIQGPALVEYPDTCAVLPPKSTAAFDAIGNLVVTINN